MPIIGSLLNNDWYNFPMSGAMRKFYPQVKVCYEFVNRNKDFPLANYIDLAELRDEIEAVKSLCFTQRDMAYLELLGFDKNLPGFLDRLFYNFKLPEVEVEKVDDQLGLRYFGDLHRATFWETPLLSIVNELVSRKMAEEAGYSPRDIRAEGLRQLGLTIDMLKANPGIRFAQFGARRRYSNAWEYEVTARLAQEVPDQMIGISNVEYARDFGYPVSGTIAHAYEMAIAALHIGRNQDPDFNPLPAAWREARDNWEAAYGDVWNGRILCNIPDTFGTDFFLSQFTYEDALKVPVFKQDSGKPKVFVKKVLGRWMEYGLNTADCRINHTDGLDRDLMSALHHWDCSGSYAQGFGIGTNLTNNVGVGTHSIIIKPIYVVEKGVRTACAKLTDNLNKAFGPKPAVERLKHYAGYSNTYTAEQTV